MGGTVPVLVHNGHPVLESHEQVRYIMTILAKDKSKLTEQMQESISETAMHRDKMDESLELAMTNDIGNCIFPITLPVFAVKLPKTMTIGKLFQLLAYTPITLTLKILQLNVMLKLTGINVFRDGPDDKGPKYMLSLAGPKVSKHLTNLDKRLEKRGTKFLCGDELTAGDMGWMMVFERMDLATWWDGIDRNSFPFVFSYWENIQKESVYLQ